MCVELTDALTCVSSTWVCPQASFIPFLFLLSLCSVSDDQLSKVLFFPVPTSCVSAAACPQMNSLHELQAREL